MLAVVRMARRTTVSRVRGFYTQDGRVPTRTTDMTKRWATKHHGIKSRKKEIKESDQTDSVAESDYMRLCQLFASLRPRPWSSKDLFRRRPRARESRQEVAS